MGFRLVPKSVTLNTLNGIMAIISPNSVAFVACHVKVVDSHQQIFSM